MYVEKVATKSEAQNLFQEVWSALDVDVFRAFDLPALIDLQNFADVTTLTKLIGHQFQLDRPAAHRRRVVANLQYFDLLLHSELRSGTGSGVSAKSFLNRTSGRLKSFSGLRFKEVSMPQLED